MVFITNFLILIAAAINCEFLAAMRILVKVTHLKYKLHYSYTQTRFDIFEAIYVDIIIKNE